MLNMIFQLPTSIRIQTHKFNTIDDYYNLPNILDDSDTDDDDDDSSEE